jgi:hypothetical protein
MTESKKLDELLITATESDNPEILSEIISILSSNEKPITKEIKDGLSMIIESWQLDPFNSPNKTRFLIEVSRFFNENFTELRSVLPNAVKKTLPAGINKATAVKILRIRNENTTLSSFYYRYNNLLELKADRFFYNANSTIWGILGKLDWITGTVALLKLNGTVLQEVDLSLILDQIYIFDNKIKVNSLVKASKLPLSKELQKTLIANSYSPIDNKIIEKSLFSLFVPEKMNPANFDKWLNASTIKEGSNSTEKIISLEKVRSINELNIFIKQNTSFTLNQNNLPKIATIFDIIKPANALKDFILWAETICLISKALTSDEILSIVSDNATIRNMLWPKHDKLNDSIGI